jgi:hypothetical protein
MKTMPYLLAVIAGAFIAPFASAQQIVDQWRYTLQRPAELWQQADFDAAAWTEGSGGFGTHDTPGARVGTVWATNAIWLRKTFDLEAVPAQPALLIHHDEDAEVYLNGQGVAVLKGFTQEYEIVPIEQRSALKTGQNVLAVHCRQTRGGQFIDVHVVDAANVPVLPEPKRNTTPFQSELITTWGEAVTAENAWTEYPRPQLVRENWQNLNGYWDYAVTGEDVRQTPEQWQGQILVPYCLESRLGGVQRLLDATEALWYRRTFTVSPAAEQRTLLHFEAVDYRCEVFVNGRSVGSHQGGNTPFCFDITDALQDGPNELLVRVEDDTEAWQLRGKQVLNARGIWYTQVSGIWQTVWLEQVAPRYIADVKITTDADAGTITVRPVIKHGNGSQRVRVTVRDDAQEVARVEGSEPALTVRVPQARLWSPESPHLYDLEISLLDAAGQPLDRVDSYAGIRTVGKTRDDDGHWQFTLNGQVIFHWGPLDQGWWPDGLLTPPSDEAMLFDIEFLKAAGFNMIRKHIKVEPRRYYYHCDRLGMMVWQDHVSGGAEPPWTRLQPNPEDAVWPDEHHQQFMLELERMIDRLENHPSIVSWVPFNERWGQHRTIEVGQWVVDRDPTRLVNIASGGNFWPVGDVVDAHRYPHPGFPFEQGAGGRFDDYIKVMGEFGGHGYPVPGHLWDANRRNWGYGGLPQNKQEYKERYLTSLQMLNELRAQGIAGGVYTQTTDVEGEINGLMTYDRKVIKIPAEELAELHKRLFVDPPQAAAAAGAAVPVSERPDHAASSRKPGPILDAEAIQAGLKSHDRALTIKAGWIRDPYIILGPDDHYYLTGTQPNPVDPREAAEPYNIGLGEGSVVGEHVRLWRSKDLVQWQYLGEPFSLNDTYHVKVLGKEPQRRLIWAPEVHWLGDCWALVHCPAAVSSLALSSGEQIEGPWTHPMGERLGPRHDPSLFRDDDGTWYLLWGNTLIAPLREDFADYTAEPVRIDPAGSRTDAEGNTKSVIGHEGATMRKIGERYVHFGTAWSTDQGRKGSYNLYYCTADEITGPYGPRKFAGRFLGHGTPFQDKAGQWWCTAFFNANVPPLPREGIQTRDLRDDAQTINEQGVTIVPLDVRILDDGDVYIRAKDPAYATPGPDEVQKFAD